MDLAETSVTEVARRVVGDQAATLVRWVVEPLTGGLTEEVGLGGGTRRVVGVVATGGERRDWSAVVKVLRRGEVRVGELSATLDDERGFDYWRREADVYDSVLLEGLPDALVAPRCYRIDDTGRGGIEVWLEDLPDQGPTAWPVERFGLAARHLGQFNGRYLTGTVVPEYPWLTRGRVRGWLAHGAPWLADPMRTRRRPGLLSTWLTDEVLDRMDGLWAEHGALLEAFDELPVTLCHHDAHRRNLGSRRVGDRECTTVLDWQLVGTGHLGEEIAAMVAVCLQFMDVPITDVAAFERHAVEGYVAGLQDAGWDGDPGQVRLGFCIAASLFMGLGGAGI